MSRSRRLASIGLPFALLTVWSFVGCGGDDDQSLQNEPGPDASPARDAANDVSVPLVDAGPIDARSGSDATVNDAASVTDAQADVASEASDASDASDAASQVDAGPCGANNGGCNANATCSVTTGTMTSCACNAGYTGNGVSCASSASFTGTTDLSVTNTGSRVCADGGEMVAYSVTTLTATTATLNVAPSAGCFSAGDELLLLNLQGTRSAHGNVGTFERVTVSSVVASTVTFTAAKVNSYGDGATDDTNLGVAPSNQRVVLQRIPHFTSVTGASAVLTAAAWDGVKGGVFAMDVATAASVAGIAMNGRGYRGAIGTFVANTDGAQGESTDGLGVRSTGSNIGGGGGGTGDRNNQGCESNGVAGGGAGYSVSGGAAITGDACGGNGGALYGNVVTSIFLGSGGGAGGTDDSVRDNPPGGFGGAGGGAVLLSGNGSVSSSLSAIGAGGQGDVSTDPSICPDMGTSSSTTSCWDFSGVGGGGSGGTVVVTVGGIVSGSVDVDGGRGGITASTSGVNGGSGAPGRMRLPAP